MTIKFYLIWVTLIFILSSTPFFSLNAQSILPICISADTSGMELTLSDRSFISHITSIPTVVSADFIKVGNIIELQEDGVLNFVFTHNEVNDTLKVFATDVRYDSISNYSWKGEIPERDGWLSIVKKPEGTSGILFYDTLLFVIDAINDTLSLLTTHEVVDTVINCNDTVFTELIDVTCAGNECAAQINILALIPPDASTWFVNETKAKMFIASLEETLNSAFKRSNISHRVKVEYEYIDYTYTQSTTGNEPIAMAANSNLIALRESRKADLVILLTNHQFSDNDLGFVAAIGPSTSNAYGIVQLKYASSPYYVFVHEIGHLLGCHHHHAHPRDWSDCPYAWEIVPNWFYTVMEPHAPELKNGYHKHRLLNFSDPLIKFAGYKTGSDGSNNEFPSNNAGRIRETGCEVANFFGGSDLVVVINGDNSLCDDPEVYTANVTPPPLGQPGQPPYIYEWRWNLDGIFTPQNPGTLLNETSYQISVPDPDLGDCSFFFLHVKVSSNGVTGHATKRIATSC